MPYDIEAFATRVRETRELRRMSRSEFARRVGVTPTGAWNWESQFTRPKPQMLSKIASALNVSESFLTTGAGSPGTIAPEGAEGEQLPDILETARQKIAAVTGMPTNRVRISVEFLTG
jgi:transcriptional regulator with XRE-family HTH domain